MRNNYREHDGISEYQECDTCHVRRGAGSITEHDDIYFGDGWDVSRCPVPGCDGSMGLPPDDSE